MPPITDSNSWQPLPKASFTLKWKRECPLKLFPWNTGCLSSLQPHQRIFHFHYSNVNLALHYGDLCKTPLFWYNVPCFKIGLCTETLKEDYAWHAINFLSLLLFFHYISYVKWVIISWDYCDKNLIKFDYFMISFDNLIIIKFLSFHPFFIPYVCRMSDNFMIISW